MWAGASRISDAKIEEAHIQGVLEGRAEAQAEYDRRLEATVAELEAKFAKERADWVKAQADVLSTALVSGLQRANDDISEQVARVLSAVCRGAHAGEGHFRSQGAARPDHVQGRLPAHFRQGSRGSRFGAKARIGDDVGGVTYATDEAADLTVSADETILEARISTWVDAIRERRNER